VSDLGSEVEYAIETSEAVTGCPDCGVLLRRAEIGDAAVRTMIYK